MQRVVRNLILTEFIFKYNLWTRHYLTLTKMYEKIKNNLKLFGETLIATLSFLKLNYNTVMDLKLIYVICEVLERNIILFNSHITDVRRYINTIYANFSNVAILQNLRPVKGITQSYDLQFIKNAILKVIAVKKTDGKE